VRDIRDTATAKRREMGKRDAHFEQERKLDRLAKRAGARRVNAKRYRRTNEVLARLRESTRLFVKALGATTAEAIAACEAMARLSTAYSYITPLKPTGTLVMTRTPPSAPSMIQEAYDEARRVANENAERHLFDDNVFGVEGKILASHTETVNGQEVTVIDDVEVFAFAGARRCGNCVSFHLREGDTLSGWCGITRPNRERAPTDVCPAHIFKTDKNRITRKATT